MNKLSEYISVRRASHIVGTLTTDDSNAENSLVYKIQAGDTSSLRGPKPFCGVGDNMSKIMFQRRLEDLFRLVFDGCEFSRFIAVDKAAQYSENKYGILPMYLLEVFEPSHCYVPIFVNDESVLAVSPFNNLCIERVSKNQYVLELFPTALILESLEESGLGKLNSMLDDIIVTVPATENTPETSVTRRQLISDLILLFSEGIKKQDAFITNGFSEVSSDIVEEVGTESIYFKKIRSLYSTESLDQNDAIDDTVINPTDFMPIYVTHQGDSGFVVVTEKEKIDGRLVNSLAIKPHIVGLTNDNGIKTILTKEKMNSVRYAVLELHDYYYVGDNTLASYCETESKIVDTVDILEMYATSLDSPMGEIGEESVRSMIKAGGEAAKDAYLVLKKFGVKVTSSIGGTVVQLFKELGVKNAKWALGQFASTFKRGIDLEKADTLELQEKLLNDELDSLEERVGTYAKTWFKSVTLSVFFGGLIFFPLSWLIARHRTRKARLAAIDRLEVRFDNIIERIERKINYAEERSENESVDQLIKERQMYQMARMRLIKLKDDAYNRGRVKYATFDKDLTLTGRQRVDAYLTGGKTLD